MEDLAPVKWAAPGKERQDSVESGFREIEEDAALVAIHDSARPLISAEDLRYDPAPVLASTAHHFVLSAELSTNERAMQEVHGGCRQ